MAGATRNVIEFTNVGQSIPLSATVTVSYSNSSLNNATLTVTCAGATVTPASLSVAPGSGTATFTVTHTMAAMGHTLSATLTQNGSLLGGTEIGVNVVNPVNE